VPNGAGATAYITHPRHVCLQSRNYMFSAREIIEVPFNESQLQMQTQ
jgi:hypothetical protein